MRKSPEWGGVPSEVDTTGDPPFGATRAHRRNRGRGGGAGIPRLSPKAINGPRRG